MRKMTIFAVVGLGAGLAVSTAGESKDQLTDILVRPIIGPKRALIDLQKYVEPRIPKVPALLTAQEWTRYADKVRSDVLDKVVYRGAAAGWRDGETQVKWLDTLAGGPGYQLKKVRFEAVPGLWVPALLYEPEKLAGKVACAMNVMGHDRNGKEADYQQIRSINLVKRGMLVLNVEWFNFGQLRDANYGHGRMNQLDLCGTSGLAPFYLSLKRGLDVLLSHPNADPSRVAVSGLSGGGWQTIYISALDPRVTLSNPVAGYSSFRTRLKYFKDLGDSEQTPTDMATVADYDHFTAMLAPRHALLTFNAKDECCFEAGYALPPLLEAAGPRYKLFGQDKALKSHINHVPGTHNYEKENREAFYRIVGDAFFPNKKDFQSEELPCADELKKLADVMVPLPDKNADFNSLARALAAELPREPAIPDDADELAAWKTSFRARLRTIVRAEDYQVKSYDGANDEKDGLKVAYWRLDLDEIWNVPVVELVRGEVKGTALVIHDDGRAKTSAIAAKLLSKGYRVLAIDPLFFGESRVLPREFLFELMVSTVGSRPLGIQASQLAAVARWAQARYKQPVKLVANGKRACLASLVAAGIEDKAIGKLELTGGIHSLKDIITQNMSVDQAAELFCFGLLEWFDIPQLAALAADRPVMLSNPVLNR